MRHHFLVVFVLFLITPFAEGQTTAPAAPAATQPTLKLTTERLVIFKDGHGLVIKTGYGRADADGRAFITDVPDAAVLGCFWATAGDDNRILAMRAEWDEQTARRSIPTTTTSMIELLRANIGKTVTLELIDKVDKNANATVDGKIVRLLDASTDEPPSRYAPLLFTSMIRNDVTTYGNFTRENLDGEGSLIRDLTPRGGEYVMVATENDKQTVVPVSHVQSLRGDRAINTETTRAEEVFTRTKRLSFDFGPESAGKDVSLRLFYFTPGLRWIPTYRVSGELKDKADLALQGEIINEVTDVEHAAVDLVVGVPNFRFAGDISPLSLEKTMRAAMVAIDSNACNTQMVNGQFSNQLDNRARVAEPQAPPADAALNVAPELNGGEQDLFVYAVDKFSLKKGARATVPLWQQSAELHHIYTLDLNTRRTRAGGSLIDDSADPSQEQNQQRGGFPSPARRGPNRIVMNQVWHQLELTNSSKVPWTTGAALMLKSNLPLGQDLLVYTPPAGKSLLPVTVAVDLRGSIDEQETSRKANAMHFDGDQYMQITKKGTITLTSFRKEKSATRVTLSTAGKVESRSDNGVVKLNDARNGDWDDNTNLRVNNHSDVTWDVEIAPGETKTITYEVSFYTR